uniref:IMPACT-like protein n=1 Tax=Magallana gigas TaxID=29159 RepID=K1R9G9_MAGGI|eukprot:XP_011437934.1 PREDICTED: protein IMPACT homolog [Crassostrea gigas]
MGNVYRDKTGTRPTGEEVILGNQVKIPVNKGKQIEDNQNRFESHATAVNSYKEAKKSLIEIPRLQTISSASHNVYAYWFAGSDGMVHDGSEDDGEHGAERTLLSAMNDNGIQNALIVVSRWLKNKIGMRHFIHIVDAGLSAGKNINPS